MPNAAKVYRISQGWDCSIRQWVYKFTHPIAVVIFYSLLYVLFFSPVIFSGRFLAPGDGIVYYLPNFYLGEKLWDPLLMSGFPVAADPVNRHVKIDPSKVKLICMGTVYEKRLKGFIRQFFREKGRR